jgi:RimJ/RimL family protein N-acetyltransferase
MNQFRTRVADDFSPQTLEEYVESQSRRMHPGLNWGVYRGDDLGGAIWFEQGSPVSGIIHTVFRKDFWGHETTYPALNAAVEEIFGAGVDKLLAMSFADNHSVRGMAKRFGMAQEGLLRSMTRRRGQLVDMVVYGLTKEEFYGNRSRNGNADQRADERRSGDRGRAVEPQEDIHSQHDADARPVAAAAAG